MLPPPDSSLPEAPRPSRGDAGWVGQGVSQHRAALPLHASTSLHAATCAAWTRLRTPITSTLREGCDIYAFGWSDFRGYSAATSRHNRGPGPQKDDDEEGEQNGPAPDPGDHHLLRQSEVLVAIEEVVE